MAYTAKRTELSQTPFSAIHLEQRARTVSFAGYALPIRIMADRLRARQKAKLIDIFHIGQAALTEPAHEMTARALEALRSSGFAALKPGRQRFFQDRYHCNQNP